MSFNLLDSVKGLISNDLISKAAGSLGETEGGISKALSGVIPSVLGGIVSKGSSGVEGASSILNMAKTASGSGILGGLKNMFGGDGNRTLLSSGMDSVRNLIGDKLGGVTQSIAGFAGLKDSSVSSLMAMIAPAALALLGKHATENNLSPASLSNMLSSQKTSLVNAMPSGLSNLGNMVGLGSVTGAVSSMTGEMKHAAGSALHTAESSVEKASGGLRWLLPVLLILFVVILIWYFMRGRNKEEASTAVTPDTTAMAVPATGPVSIKVKLPDGSELDAYRGGIEDMLVNYLNSTDPADSISNIRWFDFDNLNFKTSSADLTDESMKQVQNIAAILKAYPKVKIKIGGYTDKTGNEEDNMKLSQQRADAVVDALKKSGAASSQLVGAEGYGSKFAKAAADAPDDLRKTDRRISVSVRDK
jgi:outer membrane protein OmpA-like peptidoglycan-associated protein